ncbi:hypothetical protein KEJ15_07960 [Candidatus Bathyarchaeota archaeon]|nr:hypothetical protein [Candidatus Bathyarchaeota archaeon]
MQSKKTRRNIGREKLRQIIEACKSIEERALDPFLIDIGENIATAKQYLPDWEIPEDLCLDAETIHHLASVVKLQGDWVKHRSTSLYTDPFLLSEKIAKLDRVDLARIFLQVWHPTVELEQISLHSIAEAMRYWEDLLPLSERWKENAPAEAEIGVATREELVEQKILREQAFSEELEGFWHELQAKTEKNGMDGKIRYWDFIGAETYEETVNRAFMTSFLITYGYATLEIYPLEEQTFIKPNKEPQTKTSKKQLISIPIAVTIEDWTKWKRGELE